MRLIDPEAAFAYLSEHSQSPGDVLSVRSQPGGYTSYTYKVQTTQGIYFLKHDPGHKKDSPERRTDTDNLQDEAAAYRVLRGYLHPSKLAEVIFMDTDNAALLLTDALPGADTTLKEVIHQQKWPQECAQEVGYHIGALHGTAAGERPTVRSPHREAAYFQRLVNWIGSDLTFNDPATQSLILEKTDTVQAQQQTLLMGDLAPRNIIVGESAVAFVDLARVTLGNPSFDVGYFAGHVLLNAIEFDQLPEAGRFLDSFRGGYQIGLAQSESKHSLSADGVFDHSKIFAAGWMHRRTFQPLTVEDIPSDERARVEEYIQDLVRNESFGY